MTSYHDSVLLYNTIIVIRLLEVIHAQGLSPYLETGCTNRGLIDLRVQSVVQNTYY